MKCCSQSVLAMGSPLLLKLLYCRCCRLHACQIHPLSYSRPREGGSPRRRLALKGGSVQQFETLKSWKLKFGFWKYDNLEFRNYEVPVLWFFIFCSLTLELFENVEHFKISKMELCFCYLKFKSSVGMLFFE